MNTKGGAECPSLFFMPFDGLGQARWLPWLHPDRMRHIPSSP